MYLSLLKYITRVDSHIFEFIAVYLNLLAYISVYLSLVSYQVYLNV